MTLFKNELLSIHESNTGQYIHEERNEGRIVAILPYRKKEDSIEFLLKEVSCFDVNNNEDKNVLTIIGDVIGDDPILSVLNLLHFKCGYKAKLEDIRYISSCYPYRMLDTLCHLYTIDLSGYSLYKDYQNGDFWANSINVSIDPLTYIIYYKMKI